MQKRIAIDDKEVDFKFTLSAFYIFKNQFGYDAMNKIIPTVGEILAEINLSELAKENVSQEVYVNLLGETLQNTFNFELVDIANLIWAFAKNADRSIGEPIVWYDQFENFPLIDVLRELLPSLLESLGTKKKLTKKEETPKKPTEKKK